VTSPPQTAPSSSAAAHPALAEAVALHSSGRLDEAAARYREILARSPENFDAAHLLGVVALQQGRFDIAQRLITAALAVNPHDAAAAGNLGTSYLRDGQLEAALQWFELALRLKPDSVDALVNVASALHAMGRYVDAVPLLRRAHGYEPGAHAVCTLLGDCLLQTGETQEAATLFEAATATSPDVSTQAGQSRLQQAIQEFRKGAPVAEPTVAMRVAYAHSLLGIGQNEEAMEQLQRALALEPNNPTLRWAIALGEIKAIYQTEMEIGVSRGALAEKLGELAAWYRSGPTVPEPFQAIGTIQAFYLAYQPFNNRELLSAYGALCSEWMATLPEYAATARPDARGSAPAEPAARGRKIRLGIASAQISAHSVWNAITKGWVEHIDRGQFEILLFHLGRGADRETERAKGLVAHFEDRPRNIQDWVRAIAAQHLDVLVYPEIGMDPLTIRLASLRLAPLQATSWGHPETSGLPTMDLFISAELFEPPDAAANYAETLVKLPHLGVHVESRPPANTPLEPASLDLPSSLDLPDDEPLLICPGSPFKYSPLFDDVLTGIAKRLQRGLFRKRSGARLVFFRSHNESLDRLLEERLRRVFAAAGLDFAEHVSLIPFLDTPRFFALLRRSALMLDTLGFSGFNTALQAIECDLPVLCFEGEFLRGRLASAIMRRMELAVLIATSKDDFIAKAVALARNAGERTRLRTEIRRRREVVFNDLAPIRALERALTDAVRGSGLVA
jgi:predicted O-linked N-acetylglucosamine transferase (SPINDLY family)